ncbi:HAD family hydrolase [Desulfurella sp.]|uniref:HAD family hydrolase n=1 Tax=Desulfurella sp. TaxID=1962857 RepID=UPI0025BA01EC|nr:HAD family hydrolase [Desulfurella sp.]
MKYKNIFFDLYGTLIDIKTDDYKPEIFYNLSNFLNYEGIRVEKEFFQSRFEENIKHQLSVSQEKYPDVDIKKAFYDTILSFGYNTCDYLLDTIMKIYRTLSILEFNVFDDVHKVLSNLKKDYNLGLISDAQTIFLYKEISILSLESYFSSITHSSVLGFRKPDERIFKIALDKANVKASESVYIGDSIKRDIGSKKAGMTFILIKRGESIYDKESGEADVVVNTLEEAQHYIRSNI